MMHKMIIILRLIGGLGNQLFQLQYALNFLRKNDGELKIDDSFLAASKKSHEVVAIDALTKAFPTTRLPWFELKIKRSIERLFHKIGRPVPDIFKPSFIFEGSKLEIKNQRRLVIDGFWQNKSYINNDFIADLRSQNSVEQNFERIKNIDNNVVCVHIRRGDYLTNRRFFIRQQSVLSMDYYRRAFLYFKERNASCQFDIYTDDEDWARGAFSDEPNVVIVETRDMDPFMILLKMSCYSKYIIANSTLSWWAAVTSSAKNKEVVLPKIWGKNQSSEHLQLDGWQAL
jgi:hypothetical protein